MQRAMAENLGAYFAAAKAGVTNNSGAPIAITAGGTGDNTAVTGFTIDRQDYDSLSFLIVWLAALGATETLDLNDVEYQESDDGSNWDTAVALQADSEIGVGAAGGSNESGVVKIDLALRGKKRYIRLNFTPDLSASSTDTAVLAAVAVLGGDRVLPPSV